MEGQAGIIRIYLPAISKPVELERIEFVAADGKQKEWNFRR
jgi:hypothetical protein